MLVITIVLNSHPPILKIIGKNWRARDQYCMRKNTLCSRSSWNTKLIVINYRKNNGLEGKECLKIYHQFTFIWNAKKREGEAENVYNKCNCIPSWRYIATGDGLKKYRYSYIRFPFPASSCNLSLIKLLRVCT